MKKIMIAGIISTLLLVACEDEVVKENSSTTEVSNTEESSSDEEIEVSDFKKIISETMSADSKLKNYSIEDSVITATIELEKSDLFEPYLMAESCYSTIGDALLPVEGWETLKINFEGIGEVAFDRSESEENEYGAYFPTAKIIEKVAAAK